MDIVIDLTTLNQFLALSFDQQLARILILYGWIPLAVTFLYGTTEAWLYYIQMKWGAKNAKYIFLAIDIPRNNEQSTRAIENMFNHLSGAHSSSPDKLVNKWWIGRYQLGFSFEIVSIDGYTQFIIRSPKGNRNFVESVVYAQYPDAEITEINDYTEGAPTKFPNEEYDVWGSEFIPAKNHMLPFKTYKEFEHNIGSDTVIFQDPMAALMDLCSSMGKGEQLWTQILITPIGFDWMEEGDKIISKILKEKIKKNGIFNKFAEILIDSLHGISGVITGAAPAEARVSDDKDDSLKMMNLKPKEKKQVEAIQEKISRVAFKCKIRMAYIGKKEVFNKGKGAGGYVGYMKQFAYLDINNLKVDSKYTKTSAYYIFPKTRLNSKKRKLVNNYIARDSTAGKIPFILNVEELATLWHFPTAISVQAPLVQKVAGKKVSPPMELPTSERMVSEEITTPIVSNKKEKVAQDEVFSNNKEVQEKINSNLNLEENIFLDSEEMEEEGKKDLNNKKSQANKKGIAPVNLPM